MRVSGITTDAATEVATEKDARWEKVLARDSSSDGVFLYAVKTTGVYCRPSCPSRRAKPKNVEFFSSSIEAEAAGYRACQRCRPKGPSLAAVYAASVVAACRLIEQSEELPKLEKLAASVGMSSFHFHRQFKAITGLTPRAYGTAHRAKKVRTQLAATDQSVTGAIYEAGFNSNSRFYEKSNERLGMTPTAFQRGGKAVDS